MSNANNSNVVKLASNNDIYKIEGIAFEKIREISRLIETLDDKHQQYMKKIKKEADELKEKLWGVIVEETGLDRDKNFTLNHNYERLGFYIVELKEDNSIMDILKKL